MVNYRNCVGCHIIENRGGYIRRFYPPDQINLAPPVLNGEGAKVQPEWLFSFLQSADPDSAVAQDSGCRPSISITMKATRWSITSPRWPSCRCRLSISIPTCSRRLISKRAQKLMSKDYFNCFSCHQQGDKHPEGPPEGWAPDLGLAHARLNPDWIPLMAEGSAGDSARHQDAVVLSGWSRRHPEGQRGSAAQGDSRLHLLVRYPSGADRCPSQVASPQSSGSRPRRRRS